MLLKTFTVAEHLISVRHHTCTSLCNQTPFFLWDTTIKVFHKLCKALLSLVLALCTALGNDALCLHYSFINADHPGLIPGYPAFLHKKSASQQCTLWPLRSIFQSTAPWQHYLVFPTALYGVSSGQYTKEWLTTQTLLGCEQNNVTNISVTPKYKPVHIDFHPPSRIIDCSFYPSQAPLEIPIMRSCPYVQ